MPAKKLEFKCETCGNTHKNTMKEYTGYIKRFEIYECPTCRRERRKAETKKRAQSPERKEAYRKRMWTTLICPECKQERQVRKYGDPNRLCSRCNSVRLGKSNKGKGKPKKPEELKNLKKDKLVDIECSVCHKIRKIKYFTRKSTMCKDCAYKEKTKKAAIKKAKSERIKKDYDIKKRAEVIKAREKKLVKVTTESTHIIRNNSYDDQIAKEKSMIDDWLSKNKPTIIEPKDIYIGLTGCVMKERN